MYEIAVKTSFSAAHFLCGHEGPCKELHGHNWGVEAVFASETLDAQGMVIDFADASKALARFVAELDHKTINKVQPFDTLNPTAENIAKWLFDRLKEKLPLAPARVTVHETDTSSATYRG